MSDLTDRAMNLLDTEYPDLMKRLRDYPSCDCTNNTDDAALCRQCQLIRFAELRVRIAELEDAPLVASARATMTGTLKDERIAELEAELADWREGGRRILAEECASDEKHCTCVPALRKEIKRLRDLVSKIVYWKPMEASLAVLGEIRNMAQDEVDREVDEAADDDKPDSS